MMVQLPYSEREWVQRELPFYAGTPVEIIDIIIGHIRISYIFNIPAKDIRADFGFGKELNSSFESNFKSNEMKQISYDIEDMILVLDSKEVPSAVNTLKDYVILLSRCRSSQNVEYYKRLVEGWLDLLRATSFGHFLKSWFGFLPKRYLRKNHSEIVDFCAKKHQSLSESKLVGK